MCQKKCIKCDSIMEEDQGVYTCLKCLKELVDFKRKQWEQDSKVIELEKELEGQSNSGCCG
jgi:hypothetical protein